MTPDAIDLMVFRHLQATAGRDAVVELAEGFLDETPRLLAELRGTRQRADGTRFRLAAQSIKVASQEFGATTLARLAGTLEAEGPGADDDADAAAIAAVDVAFRDAAQMLAELIRD